MEKYSFVEKLAEGAYGTVWRCVDKETGAIVAVKKLKEPPQTKQDADFAMREVRLLQQINHINVVRMIEAYQSASGRLYLVFEFVESTILQLLKAYPQAGGMPIKQVQSIMWQLAQAIAHLHKKKIIHRDIKPSNILIDNDGLVKLCDFGFARPFAMGSDMAAQYTTYVVTRWYRPPEVLVGDTYGPSVDIWAMGCIFAELVTGKPLFPGKTQHDQLWLVLKAVGSLTDRQMKVMKLDSQYACFKMPQKKDVVPLDVMLPSFTPTMMDFLKACLQPDASKRSTADQLLAHPFFTGVIDILPDVCRPYVPEDSCLPNDITSKLDSIKAHQAQARATVPVQAHHLDGTDTGVPDRSPLADRNPEYDIAPAEDTHPKAMATSSSPKRSSSNTVGSVAAVVAVASMEKHAPVPNHSAQTQAAAVRCMPPGLPVPKHTAAGLKMEAHAAAAGHRRQLSGGSMPADLGPVGSKELQKPETAANAVNTCPTDRSYLGHNLGHNLGHSAGHNTTSKPPVQFLLQHVVNNATRGSKEQECVVRRPTWHGDPDAAGTMAGNYGPHDNSLPSIQSMKQALNACPSSVQQPADGHAAAPDTRASKDKARYVRRSNTCASDADMARPLGSHMSHGSANTSAHGSRLPSPSHATTDIDCASRTTAGGSSQHGGMDTCDMSPPEQGVKTHAQPSIASTYAGDWTAFGFDHGSKPMAIVGKAHFERPKPSLSSHQLPNLVQPPRNAADSDMLMAVMGDDDHWDSAAAIGDSHVIVSRSSNPLPVHHMAGPDGSMTEAMGFAAPGVHNTSLRQHLDGISLSASHTSSGAASGGTHALEKATQRLSKAAKLMSKLPPSGNSGAGAAGNRGQHGKAGITTPRSTFAGNTTHEPAGQAPAPRLSLNGPNSMPGMQASGSAALSLPSLGGSRDKAPCSNTSSHPAAFDSPSLPSIPSRKSNQGKGNAVRWDGLQIGGMGIAEVRVNRGVPC